MRFFGMPWLWSVAAALGIYIGCGGWRFLRIIFKTALRDLLAGGGAAERSLRLMAFVRFHLKAFGTEACSKLDLSLLSPREVKTELVLNLVPVY
ncbi:UNVERIFIED_CONTAM: hypothetical protein K2H54_046712 [Gekko kuhli]